MHNLSAFLVANNLLTQYQHRLLYWACFATVLIGVLTCALYWIFTKDAANALALGTFTVASFTLIMAVVSASEWLGRDKPDTYTSVDDLVVGAELGLEELESQKEAMLEEAKKHRGDV